jgi:hypothetical protein
VPFAGKGEGCGCGPDSKEELAEVLAYEVAEEAVL